MDKTAKIVVGVAAVAAVGGLAYVVATHTQVAALQLSAASLSVAVGQDDEVTVVATDASGSPVAGVTGISLQSDGSAIQDFPATDSTGTAALAVSFSQAGTFVLQAVL